MTRIAILVSAFVALSIAVGAGATDALDAAALDASRRLADPRLDLIGSLLTALGQFELTAPLAVALAIVGYRRFGVPGLAPLLLFPGVAVELVAKFVVPQPPPPVELDRDLGLLRIVYASSPYSFPSGHQLRATFLALLLAPSGVARALAWVFVAAMALTRVYLVEHWLADVVGGVLLALLLVAVARYSRPWRRAP